MWLNCRIDFNDEAAIWPSIMVKRIKSSSKPVEYWLLIMLVLVAAMIVIGGATRLTNSGLSITEWAPIKGALPPFSHEAWLAEFEKYKQIPEFEAEHPDMDLAGFKFIYFWEWSHRQLGRLIGLAYVVPLILFWVTKRLPKGNRWGFFMIAVLIGLQGAVGWWMVYSGLQDGMVDVSQYRLATHLGLAFLILAVLFWMWLSIRNLNKTKSDHVGGWGATGLAALIYLQILAGAFMAGTHSGKTYNEWPLMDGDFIPAGYGVQTPFWRNIFENPAAIQFNHRLLAYLICIFAVVYAWRSRKIRGLRGSVFVLLALIGWQIGLGIWTLLAVAPLNLSLLHQFTSIFVFLAALYVVWVRRNTVK